MEIKSSVPLKVIAAAIIALTVAVTVGSSSSLPNAKGVPERMVITVRPAHPGATVPETLAPGDFTVLQSDTPVPVLGVERLATDLSDMQLFVLLDDSTRSSSLSLQLSDLRTFLKSLPPAAQVAIGYMRNGSFQLSQPFTADHQKVAAALRLPQAIPGVNGSPYFALSDLVKRWPSSQPAARRAVLMLTDGVDRYYDSSIVDDPYVDTAIQDALQHGVTVSSIYLRGAGFYGRGGWVTNMAQSRLMQVGDQTGGNTYFLGLTDPVTITPFLDDFRDRLENQYQLTFAARPQHGLDPVKLRTELPGVRIEGPSRIYVR